MKKAIIILLSIFLLSGCDEITDFISFFVDIEPNRIEGTENTEFVFKANTNDTVEEWIIDGAIIPANTPRGATIKNRLEYSFSSGTHKIGVLTRNGATDEVEIIVSPVEIVFNISAVIGENTTEIYLDYPLLTIEGTEYNIETTGNLNIIETESQNIISLQITVDQTDRFCFVNNNAMEVYGVDLTAVTISQMNELIMIWFPERLEDPEPVIPFYSNTRFNLSGHSGAVSDYLTVYDDRFNVSGIDQLYVDNAVYMDDLRKVVLSMQIDNKDSFLFINYNMQNFFNIDLQDMSHNELVIAADILNRYDGTNLLELMEVYP